ncbi:hypothetical protein AOCH_006820 [Aspergillus ochraceoroseus]|uniref:Zn(2)-C6 fungal-type domain-containing protein n=1 Tax=Aspergillus ochraceoroseus TaxID=138278 RepID=A0A0F8WQ32_9EURO|nr:hypothetical protein AOCH_006820 [Aspergillus ochraceoroseus]
MIVALETSSSVNLRPFGFLRRDSRPAAMEIVTADDKPQPLPPYSGSAPPMHRIPPSEGSHGVPGGPGLYDHSWRQYPSSFDTHPAEQRRTSAPQPSLPSHGYPSMNRELPQLPTDGPYGRPGSLPAPSQTPTEPTPPHASFHPMNGTPHEPAPHSAPPEYRPRIPFPPQEPHSNGDAPPPHSLPPSQYPTTVPPPVSHTPVPYDSSYYQNPAYGMRQRKAARAQQFWTLKACDQCRARKAKCDEGRPACSHCKENNLICVYKEVPPHKQEKATQLILDRMQQMEDRLEDRLTQFQKIQVEQNSLLGTLSDITKIKDRNAPVNKELQKLFPFLKSDAPEVPQEPEIKEQTAPAGVQKIDITNPLEQQLLQTGEDGELSIPVEHTTAAHKLLGWPSIKSLLLPYLYDEDYVMKLEEERGLIRLYGRGEGDDSSEERLTPSTSLSASWDERYHPAASPNGGWNANFKSNGYTPKQENKDIDEDGMLSVDAETLRGYRNSYLEHIHKLHPFLDQTDLDKGINQFINIYCLKTSPPQGPPLNPLNTSTDAPRGAKRKRSFEALRGPGYDMRSPGAKPDGSPTSQPVAKSINNAIILLVFALGRICQVRSIAIAGPITDQPTDYRQQHIPSASSRTVPSPSGSDSMLPPQGSFYSSYQNPPLSSPLDSSNNGAHDNSHLRNIDVIPGLAYYAHATRILGSLQGINTLPHVQAALLAGLYAGQLAHPYQSHGWIYQACRACQVLVRSKRDILAELDLPASGISRSEARIALPKGRFTLSLPNDMSAPSTIMMFFYSAQIHLRKLPEVMRWKDTDPPSDDINVARMRAKYYGARYIIHRPLLYHALHYSGPNAPSSVDSPVGSIISGSKSQQVSPSMTHNQRATNMSRISSDIGMMGRNSGPSNQAATLTYRDLPTKLRRACKVCVDSAILSTEAFDGIQNSRPVVTNIFGTAHAQFGNMLVLSTTYMSHLSELVDRNDLERLLKRTIAFLLQSRHISPSLRADAKILTEIYERIFGDTPVVVIP